MSCVRDMIEILHMHPRTRRKRITNYNSDGLNAPDDRPLYEEPAHLSEYKRDIEAVPGRKTRRVHPT